MIHIQTHISHVAHMARILKFILAQTFRSFDESSNTRPSPQHERSHLNIKS